MAHANRDWAYRGLILLSLVATGCTSRLLTDADGGSTPSAATTGRVPTPYGTETEDWVDKSGLYLWPMETSLAPGLPLQFLVSVRDWGSEMDVEVRPLTLDQGSRTEPRQPSDPVFVGVVPVSADAFFEIDMRPDVRIPGDANPITGTDLTVQLLMTGAWIPEADFACGITEGFVIEPQPMALSGSTFAAVRVEGPDSLPREFPVSCD